MCWISQDRLHFLLNTMTLTCITEVGGFYDVFGSSYLHHRGLGVSDEVFESSSWADHKLKVNKNFLLNENSDSGFILLGYLVYNLCKNT